MLSIIVKTKYSDNVGFYWADVWVNGEHLDPEPVGKSPAEALGNALFELSCVEPLEDGVRLDITDES